MRFHDFMRLRNYSIDLKWIFKIWLKWYNDEILILQNLFKKKKFIFFKSDDWRFLLENNVSNAIAVVNDLWS